MPVTTPEVTPIVATVEELELHVPPVVALVRESVPAGHIAATPLIDVVSALIVAIVVDWQPVVNLYVIIAVPADMPLITPPDVMVATEVVPEDHVPPVVGLLSVAVAPIQAAGVPTIAAGLALTVTEIVLLQPVGSV
jgi:hypothetical protein